MPDGKSITLEIREFLENCPFEMFIEKINNSHISMDDLSEVDATITMIRQSESKLRRIRQQIEYQVRKHRLEEFRERS